LANVLNGKLQVLIVPLTEKPAFPGLYRAPTVTVGEFFLKLSFYCVCSSLIMAVGKNVSYNVNCDIGLKVG
jgi:hypothetical protein